jgi:hypothetical protein
MITKEKMMIQFSKKLVRRKNSHVNLINELTLELMDWKNYKIKNEDSTRFVSISYITNSERTLE